MLVRADSTGLILAPPHAGPAVRLAFSQLRGVDMSIGALSRGQGFRRGAKMGFLIGAGVGAVATAFALNADLRGSCSDCMIPATAVIGVYSLAFTAATTLAGGWIGLAARERWRQVWPYSDFKRPGVPPAASVR